MHENYSAIKIWNNLSRNGRKYLSYVKLQKVS